VSDPRRIGAWSTLFEASDGARIIDDGDHIALRWRWAGADEPVDGTIAFDEDPFRVRYEGKTEDGTRFDVHHGIAASATGARLDVVVDLEPPPSRAGGAAVQRDLDRAVDQMTARVYTLLERSRGNGARRRATLLPRRPRRPPAPAIPSTVAVRGHPLHPMLVPFPIACLVATLVADLVFVAGDSAFVARTARWLAIAGAIAGFVAGLAGGTDFLTRRSIRQIRWAWVHALGNLAAVGLSACNFALRLHDPEGAVQPWGLTLSIVVVAILAVTWWIGGELAYRHHVGMIVERSGLPRDTAGVEPGGRQ
jgi:uncharacterized membrane protein